MNEVSFYHLTKSDMRKALPTLLEKALASGNGVVLMANDEEKLKEIDGLLWTFSTNRFIPHGTHNEDYREDQPVYLTTAEENPNNADILVTLGGVQPEYVKKFSRVLDIFDGNSEEEVSSARKRWKSYRGKKLKLIYWQQNEKGGWEQAAE